MAADTPKDPDKPPMTVAELVALTKDELDSEDAERRAKLQAASAGAFPRESQTGVTLDLSSRNIRTLPVEIIGLIKDKVERLALSHNPQIAVPTQILQCDRLRYLNIRWNDLISFPEAVLQLSKLEILDLSKNRIVSIPEGIKNMTSLKFLAIARNRITRLPLALGDMTSLSKLKFDENPIEFPPSDVYKPPQDRTVSAIEAVKERDVCQKVKRFLKAASLRQRLKTNLDEDLSESNVETPRPPKRSVTGGRFPIRPSISGIDHIPDVRADSPSDFQYPPPIPQKSHARVASINAPLSKRPGIAPLRTAGNDVNRSRSETVSSSASLRQRRQGVVQPRKPTSDLKSVSEASSQRTSQASTLKASEMASQRTSQASLLRVSEMAGQRTSQASTIKASHSRNTSTTSTVNGFLAASSGETSSGALSPVDGHPGRFGSVRRLSSLPENRNSRVQTTDPFKGPKRLLFTLYQLQRPVRDVAVAVKDGSPKKSPLERLLFTACAHVDELDRLIHRWESSFEDGGKKQPDATKAIVNASVQALKSYGFVTAELKRNASKILQFADGIYVRCLMFQIYATMVEARNVCKLLGCMVKDRAQRKDTPRMAAAWSSRTVTPTQPRPNTSRRQRGAEILQRIGSQSTLRSMPPPVPLNANGSRTNTMTSLSAATPRSAESFSTMVSSNLSLSRTNTMRSVTDEGDSEEQFDRIFLKLKSACDLAAQALPQCYMEFKTRKENTQNQGLSRIAHYWSMALSTCERVMADNKALRKQLEVVKVNDPGVRYQRDFWQLCDTFVKSWTDLATEVKDIGSQRVEIQSIKSAMRKVQVAVKDVSKTISHSPLYHQAVGSGTKDSAGPHSLAPPFPSALGNSAFAATTSGISGLQQSVSSSGYVTPNFVPATPLSAALGPAVQATVASTPNGTQTMVQRDYFAELPPPPPQQQTTMTARQIIQRNDTVMRPPQDYGRR